MLRRKRMIERTDKAFDVVVVGGANTDFLVRAERLPRPGESVQGDLFQEACGGKGANQAVAAARLGARVAMIGKVGNDTRGQKILETLDTECVDRRFVFQDPEIVTGTALIVVNQDGQKQIAAALGANRNLTVAEVEAASEILENAKVLLMQLEVPLECVEAAARIAKRRNTKVVLDPAPAIPLPNRLLRMVDIIRPNATEAEMLTGIHVKDRGTARSAARALCKRGAKAAMVQAQGGANILVSSRLESWFPEFHVLSLDATGAGDAMAAALAVELGRGETPIHAASFAQAAAALKTRKIGAQAGLPTRSEIEAFLKAQEKKAA